MIRKNQEIVAELVPFSDDQHGRWGDVLDALLGLPVDADFADDLESLNQVD